MNKRPTKKFSKRVYKIEKSKRAEDDLIEFCDKNEILYQKLDDIDSKKLRIKYLKDPKGKCPDFLITKKSLSCFIEVKALTNFTNAKREKEMDERREFLYKSGKSGILINGVFDIISELVGPFRTFIQSASDKFKNLKVEHKYPRILLLGDDFVINTFSVYALFFGAYPSYKKINEKLQYIGFQKTKPGLFDKTGSNISAVIYWNRDQKRYYGIENPKAIVKFSEDRFNYFFS